MTNCDNAFTTRQSLQKQHLTYQTVSTKQPNNSHIEFYSFGYEQSLDNCSYVALTNTDELKKKELYFTLTHFKALLCQNPFDVKVQLE